MITRKKGTSSILALFTLRLSHRICNGHWRRNFAAALLLALLSLSPVAGQSVNPGPTPNEVLLPKFLTSAELASGMTATSHAFRDAIKKIRPCLVTIESFGGVSTVQGRIGGIRKQGEGATTGLVLSSDGYLLTSTFNFIQQQPLISVITSDGVRRVARIVGQDETRKICMLKIDGVNDLPVPDIVKLDEMQIGQWTISVGVGYGDTVPAISKGILSAKNRIGGRAIQTDSRISPANYGGPLLDKYGRVLGICVPLDPQSAAVGAGVEWYDSGIGFAIPLDNASHWVDRLKAGETISPAFLGVKVIPNPGGKGLRIEQVVSRGPAQNSGLRHADIIVALDGQEVNDLLRLKQILNRCEAGQEIHLNIIKDGEKKPSEVTVLLGIPPKPQVGADPLMPPEIR